MGAKSRVQMILIANSQDLSGRNGIGGVKTHVELLCSKLVENNVDFCLRTGLGKNEVLAKLSFVARSIFTGTKLEAQWIYERARLLRAFDLDKKPCLVHAHDPISGLAFMSDDHPLVVTVHGPFAEESKSAGRSKAYVENAQRIEERVLERADAIISVDQGQKDLLVSKYSIGHKVSIISNAVDSSCLRAIVTKTNLCKDLQTLADSRFFILTRRLVPKNGARLAVEAFLEWSGDQTENIKLILVGDGPEKSYIQGLIKAHRNGSAVRLLGALPNDVTLALLARATACVVPSIPDCGVVEATSLSVLEALGVGVPVIGSQIGGIEEIGKNVGGIRFVRAGERDDLVRAFTDLAGGVSVPEFREVRFQQEYGADAWIKRIQTVYHQVSS